MEKTHYILDKHIKGYAWQAFDTQRFQENLLGKAYRGVSSS